MKKIKNDEWKLIEDFIAKRFAEILLVKMVLESKTKAHMVVVELKKPGFASKDRFTARFVFDIEYTPSELIDYFFKHPQGEFNF